MDSVLVVADWPETEENLAVDEVRRALYLLKGEVQEVRQRHPSIAEHHAGTWSIPLTNGLQALAALCTLLNKSSYGYRVLLFDEPPKWVVTEPRPKKNV